MSDLKNKHVVITGGSRGIGSAVADRMDRLGARISLLARSATAVQEKAAALSRALAIAVDVSDEQAVNKAFQTLHERQGPVDILVNNAGAADSRPFQRMDSDNWHDMFAVNLHAAFYCSRAVIADMQDSGWGRIINMASTAGVKGYRYVTAYCAAKHGVIGLTRALALETARDGITVNAVCPGFTNTPLLEESLANIMEKTGMDRDAAENSLKSVNPQQRLVEPAEVANTVAWLCLPGSESVTGQSLVIAGGEVML